MSVIITYNGLTLTNVNLTQVSSETIYDEAGRGRVVNQTIIRATGTLNFDDPSALNFVLSIEEHRQKLLQPRANLLVQIGDTKLFDIKAPDSMDGPKPRKVEITEITGIRFAVVNFEIEINQAECPSAGQASVAVSNSFSVTHTLDERFMVTRTISGRLTIRTDSTVTIDALRGQIVPKVPTGFKRISMRFVASATSNELLYEIVDQEQYFVGPKGSVRASGTYTHKLVKLSHFINTLQIELEGPKTEPKAKMLSLIKTIMLSRINFIKEQVLSMTLQESLYDNIIRLDISTRAFDLADDVIKIPKVSTMFRALPGSESNESTNLGPYGSALIAAAKQLFFDACVGGSLVAGSLSGQSAEDTGFKISTKVVPRSALPKGPTSNDHQSKDQAKNPYLHFEESFRCEVDNALIQLPSSLPGAGVRVYQVHEPLSRMIQQGLAVRLNKPVDIPPPKHGTDTFVGRTAIEPHAPELNADFGTFEHAVSWFYEILIPREPQAGVYSQTDLTCPIPTSPMTDNKTDDETDVPKYKLESAETSGSQFPGGELP